jgi:hypothetical protein
MLHERLEKFYSENAEAASNTNLTVEIDNFYSEIVTALLASASETAPVKSSNFRKPWWDDNLDYLKSA